MLNFLRSACHRDIDVRNLVVFAADDKVEAALKAVGVHTFSHAALGQFDANAARSYGDHTFVEMMWLKLTCVYLVNDLGYDLLFQDADLYWWRAPWAYGAASVDTFWMDDGARTSASRPTSPTRATTCSRERADRGLAEALVGMYDVVLAWQSHQAVVSQVLGEMHALHALTVQILEKEAFPSGKQLHHNRPLFAKIADGP
ncbi:nucleotide-diphospho-sugar transferase [Aureococcus anophagefferens]|nr:nucleotide-diphospho-sugar transferase [Aureococcus anophagefferens]